MNPKLKRFMDILFAVLFISAQLMEFFGHLPEDLGYIKKLVSWAALGYLFIRVSLSNILFCHKRRKFDISLVLLYFLFGAGIIVEYAKKAMHKAVLFHNFLNFLSTNAAIIEKYCIYVGGILLLFIAIYAALRFEIRKPSLLAAIMEFFHKTGELPISIGEFIGRFFVIFLVLAAFSNVVFKLAIEWLGIILDAPFVTWGVFFYLVYYIGLLAVRHIKMSNPEHIVHKLGRMGEDFYEKFIEMFHYKKTLHLGVMGILALHPLTDTVIFVILYYLFGLKNILYFEYLGEAGHTPIMQLLLTDISFTHIIGSISLVLTYLFNVIAILFLLSIPVFIWYRFFRGKPLHVSRTTLALVFSSLLCFILTPVFSIKAINVREVAGVDILTQSILSSSSIIDYLIKDRITAVIIVASSCLLFGLITWLLEFNKKIEKEIFIGAVLVGLGYFGYYIFHYFLSYFQHYIVTIDILSKSNDVFSIIYVTLFALIRAAFYIGGYLFFLYEIYKRHLFRYFSF